MHRRFFLGLLLLPAYLFAQQFEPINTFVQFNSNPIEVVSFTPDERSVIGGDSEGHIYFWDLNNGSLLKIVRAHKEKIKALSISPDGKSMVTAGNDGKIITWDLETWNILKSIEISESVNFIAFGSNNVIYYITGQTVFKAAVENLESPVAVYKNDEFLTTASMTPDLSMIGLSSGKLVYLLNLEKASIEREIRCCKKKITDIDFDNQILGYKCETGTITILNLETGNQIELNRNNTSIGQISFSNHGQYLAEGSGGSMATLWNTETGEKIADLKGHKATVNAFDFNKDDTYLLTGSEDGRVNLWSIPGMKKYKKEVIVTKDTIELVYSELQIPTYLKGRNVETQETAKINSPELDVFVWDNENVDGDTISLNFNGAWILKDYSVTKTRKKIVLNLNPNSNNYLILYAHNLGKNPPNTAAISFVNGTGEKILTLNSDLKKCGAVNFVFK